MYDILTHMCSDNRSSRTLTLSEVGSAGITGIAGLVTLHVVGKLIEGMSLLAVDVVSSTVRWDSTPIY
jgi:hypothetical protein